MIRSTAGGSMRSGGRADDDLGVSEVRNEIYRPPPVCEERWSPQESGLGPHVHGHKHYANARRGEGGCPGGDSDREFIGGDDQRGIHK